MWRRMPDAPAMPMGPILVEAEMTCESSPLVEFSAAELFEQRFSFA
jgi:hypothetical protein